MALHLSESRMMSIQAAQKSLEAARDITRMVMTSLSTMETDAANFRERVNSSSLSHDQGLVQLAEAYEVCFLCYPHLGGLEGLRTVTTHNIFPHQRTTENN